jgi:hypothetical protein
MEKTLLENGEGMIISIGYANFLESRYVAAISRPDSTQAREIIRGATQDKILINATKGRKAKKLNRFKEQPYANPHCNVSLTHHRPQDG